MLMDKSELCRRALQAMKNAYCPYSGYAVGAALLAKSGAVYTGCNIENASFSPTVCAERTAVFKAVSEGEREFCAIAVAGGKNGEVTGAFPPCGVCRQVLAEFCSPDFKVYILTGPEKADEYELRQLLPSGFGPDFIEQNR